MSNLLTRLHRCMRDDPVALGFPMTHLHQDAEIDRMDPLIRRRLEQRQIAPSPATAGASSRAFAKVGLGCYVQLFHPRKERLQAMIDAPPIQMLLASEFALDVPPKRVPMKQVDGMATYTRMRVPTQAQASQRRTPESIRRLPHYHLRSRSTRSRAIMPVLAVERDASQPALSAEAIDSFGFARDGRLVVPVIWPS